MHAYDHFNDRRPLRQRPPPSAGGLAHRSDPDIEQQGVDIKLVPLGVLFLQGARAAFLYRVKWGELRLYRMLADGKRQAIEKACKGNYCRSVGNVYAVSCTGVSGAEAMRFRWSSEVIDLPSRPIAHCSLAGSLGILLDFANSCNWRDKASEFTVPISISRLSTMLEIGDDGLRRVVAILRHWGMIGKYSHGEIVVNDIDSLERLLDRLFGYTRGMPAEERSPKLTPLIHC
jgi:hypothetical protein